jgi:16S rRNA (cytosine1402-N4)-methyltransferase
MQSIHKPVLLQEVVRGILGDVNLTPDLSLQDSNTIPWYVDCTLGGAGHALAIAKALNGNLNILAFDRDPLAVERGYKSLNGLAKQIIIENINARNIKGVLNKHSINSVKYILMDLGISSDELENSGRGFSFLKDEPLLMTMGDPSTYEFTAKTIVNEWQEENIADILYGYGEERFSRRIAHNICTYRTKKIVETSMELAEIIKNAVPVFYRRGKIHPATKSFQALRIAVNDELKSLEQILKDGYDSMETGGKMAVISFHSLEDRIVKNFFKNKSIIGSKIITKKPVIASEQELLENPRARSAKLRILQK